MELCRRVGSMAILVGFVLASKEILKKLLFEKQIVT